jgi:hypothetical protein
LNGIAPEHLCDWRGEATIVPPRRDYEMRPRYGPTVPWCGIPVTRIWRCGNRGNVASVLIEKPARGSFLPIVDGGYSLQYSPLLEYREGRGVVLFCQLDVTGRTETDPAADLLARNLIHYALGWKPAPNRRVIYVGDPGGARHLASAGIAVAEFAGGVASDEVLVVGPGGGKILARDIEFLNSDWERGSYMLAIGLDEAEANAFLRSGIRMKSTEHISTGFDRFGPPAFLAGIGPADVHIREPRELPLIVDVGLPAAGAAVIGDGVLARVGGMNAIFCQLVPWQFDYTKQYNLKRTYRRVSFLVSRLLANMGVQGTTPILDRLSAPVAAAAPEERWLDGLYLDQPEEWDDPYRFFRW